MARSAESAAREKLRKAAWNRNNRRGPGAAAMPLASSPAKAASSGS